MSGIGKAIGKVFRAVGNIAKKVLPAILGIGAIVFTAGAALGFAPLAGGFGGAVSSGLSAIGIPTTGVIGSALTGAVTQAGYGAALGGATAALTGQDISKGAALGALGGAVTGGVTGGLGAAAAPAASGVTQSTMSGATTALQPAATGLGAGVTSPVLTEGAIAGPAVTQGATNGPAGLISGFGKMLTSPVGGSVISGLGQGLLAGFAQKDADKAARDEQDRRTDSYNVDPSAYDAPVVDDTARPDPSQVWRPRRHVVYNPQTRRIEHA